MNSKPKHNQQFIHETKNGKKNKYELDNSSENKKKEKSKKNPRNKTIIESKEKKVAKMNDKKKK
jgi:hypothetical protein